MRPNWLYKELRMLVLLPTEVPGIAEDTRPCKGEITDCMTAARELWVAQVAVSAFVEFRPAVSASEDFLDL
jgi:hypothetical protein